MQSLRSRYGSVTFRQKITSEEMDRIRIKAREKIDEVIFIFKQLPRCFLLTLRLLTFNQFLIEKTNERVDRNHSAFTLEI